MKIKEVIIVEGKSDIGRVLRSVDAEIIPTYGFVLSPETLSDIEAAYRRCGIIILTDPDGAGERIRRYLTQRFPEAKHAFVPKEDAIANDDLGIEQASPEAIRSALRNVRSVAPTNEAHFTVADLWEAGAVGTHDAAALRARLGARLGIGYANAKRFLARLNHYGVTREEWAQALREEQTDGI